VSNLILLLSVILAISGLVALIYVLRHR